MCEFCSQFGHGNRWYLNPDNFSDELLQDERRQKVLDMVAGWGIDYFMERATRPVVPPASGAPGPAPTLVQMALAAGHAGQVITLEDALRLTDLARDFVAVPCMCRRLVGGLSETTCINFGPIKELTGLRKAEERVIELTRQEARQKLLQFDEIGFVHQVLYTGFPFPTVICNCDRKYCTSFKVRFLRHAPISVLRGHEICVVDPERCDGCSGRPQCLRLCQFGALRWAPTEGRVIAEPRECFGCGLCRQACPRGGLSLVKREGTLVGEVW